ncbi:hypothetical protein ACT3S9_12565 [Pseudoalteromonas sp. AOP31-A2-14]
MVQITLAISGGGTGCAIAGGIFAMLTLYTIKVKRSAVTACNECGRFT